MARPDIATVDDCLEYLGLDPPTAADRALISRIKRRVENLARAFCRHGIAQETYTHFLPKSPVVGDTSDDYVEITGDRVSIGRGSFGADVLQLPQIYVRSITSLYQDTNAKAGQGASDFAASTALTSGTDFYLDVDESGLSRSGWLIKEAGTWPRQPRTVKVTYVAGLTAAELDDTYSDIKDAICDEVQMRFQAVKSNQGNEGQSGRIKSESIGGEYSVTYDTQTAAGSGLMEDTEAKLQPYRFYGLIW